MSECKVIKTTCGICGSGCPVDPRHTVTAHDADIHLQLEPGTDGALALAMGMNHRMYLL